MKNLVNKIAELISKKEGRVVVGISGHGAAGKPSLANELIEILGQDKVNYINTDPYIIPTSSIRKYALIQYEYENKKYRAKMTACHPGAHNIEALERDIRMTKDGLNLYTIETKYKKSLFISANKKINIIEGMSVAFTDPDLFDMKVYLYTDRETELMRRTSRDLAVRGTSVELLKQSHEGRRIQYEVFMHPYHRNFDLVIKNSNEGFIVEKDNLGMI